MLAAPKMLKQLYCLINNMAATSVSEPVMVLYKSAQCRYCNALAAIWDNPPSGGGDSVTTILKKVYPKLRFYTITAKDNSGKFDENTAPKDLIRYGKWFPMLILVPGKLWDEAMSKLGPKNDVKLIDGVQVMNGSFEGDTIKYKQQYDIRNPNDFGKWLEQSLKNDDFKRVQTGSTNQIVVPLPQPQAIEPLISNMAKLSVPKSNPHVLGIVESLPGNEDLCSMRIITRPK